MQAVKVTPKLSRHRKRRKKKRKRCCIFNKEVDTTWSNMTKSLFASWSRWGWIRRTCLWKGLPVIEMNLPQDSCLMILITVNVITRKNKTVKCLGLNATAYPAVNSHSAGVQLGCEGTVCILRPLLWIPVSAKFPERVFQLQGWTSLFGHTKAVSCPCFRREKFMLLPWIQNFWVLKSKDLQEHLSSMKLPEEMILGMPFLEVPF